MKTARFALLPVLALAATAPFASAVSVTTYDFMVSGTYTLANGQIHQLYNTEYRVFDLASNSYVANYGSPDGFDGWDAFGAYDALSGTFYAVNSPYGGPASLYTFNYNSPSTGSWATGSADVVNGYAGTISNGSLYFTGLKEPYNPSSPSSNYISRFDSATNQRHLLIETGGSSAPLFTAANGDIYYATYGLAKDDEYGEAIEKNGIYRWSAEDIANVDNANPDDVLYLSDADHIVNFVGDANGITIDEAGNIIFAGGDYIAVVDINSPEGYRILLDANDIEALGIEASYGLNIGYLTALGNILTDGKLYFSPGYMSNFIGIQVPEPSTYALLAGLASLLVVARLRRRS